MIKPLIKPPRLRAGDKIGIITPSSPAPVTAPTRYKRGMSYLRKMGFDVVEGMCCKTQQAYRSATIMQRAEEINGFLRDPEIKAILSTIGGTNSNSLLPYLDYDAIRKNSKVFMGYSDVTALLLGIYAQTGIVTFYGPAVIPSFGEYPEMFPDGRKYFENVVLGMKHAPYSLEVPQFWTEEKVSWENQNRSKMMVQNDGWKCLREGQASGRLIGGNLNTISGFMASPYFPDLDGSILFIEDSWKDMALEERLFSMLKVSGAFEKIRGLIVGKHEQLDDLDAPFSLDDLLLEVIGETEIPILSHVDIGHTFPSHVFPIGIEVSINAREGTITFLENAVLD